MLTDERGGKKADHSAEWKKKREDAEKVGEKVTREGKAGGMLDGVSGTASDDNDDGEANNDFRATVVAIRQEREGPALRPKPEGRKKRDAVFVRSDLQNRGSSTECRFVPPMGGGVAFPSLAEGRKGVARQRLRRKRGEGGGRKKRRFRGGRPFAKPKREDRRAGVGWKCSLCLVKERKCPQTADQGEKRGRRRNGRRQLIAGGKREGPRDLQQKKRKSEGLAKKTSTARVGSRQSATKNRHRPRQFAGGVQLGWGESRF